MPVNLVEDYLPRWWLRSGHINTFQGGVLRKVAVPGYVRERIDTPDGDFLDLDWLRQGHTRLAILSHGLEGNSRRTYMSGMASALAANGWDVLAWNYRGCSGEPNRALRTYHSGATEDLDTVVRHARGGYHAVALVGFSLGGNLTLKYLGEKGAQADICGAVAFSVPCDLAAGSVHLARPSARPYMRRFMRSLKKKALEKDRLFPGRLNLEGLERMTTFAQFDERFTAPLNGFASAQDYWARASCKPFLSRIRTPSLLASAADDPFLPEPCYPREEAFQSQWLTLEVPRWGGHVGFAEDRDRYWSERRAVEFLDRCC